MRVYPREYFWFIERILREHSSRTEELKALEETIVACCHTPLVSDTAGGGNGGSEPERVTQAKERNVHYQRLLKRVEKVREAMKTLTDQEREVAGLFFEEELRSWEVAETLHLDERWVRRIKARILRKTSRFFIPIWID